MVTNKIQLLGLLPSELVDALQLKPTFRGKQIFKWLSSGVTSFNQMSNLPIGLRNEISEKAVIYSSSVTKVLHDPDGTIKLQITLQDGLCIETVLLIDAEERKTACVSCQAGCPMGCAFCQTGQLGFARNLTPSEIVEEFFFLEKEAGTLDNIVFMGMGEPMLNLQAIKKAISVLTDNQGRNLSARRITISTSGVIKGIYELADNGPQVRLAVSLTTANQNLRADLMPVAKDNPLSELKKAVSYYIEKSGKRCTLEAALLGGVNTDYQSINNLYDFAKNIDVHINLIPWNPVPGLEFKEPSAEECHYVMQQLTKKGINVTIRTRRGRTIGGACGQLGKTTNSG